MTPCIALLRAVNVGGNNLLPMKALPALFTGLGHTDPVTYIQSGNVVFRCQNPDMQAVSAALQQRIAEVFGLDVAVVTRTAAELARVVADNPFPAEGAQALYVMFLVNLPSEQAVARVDPLRSPPDRFVVRGREVYLHLDTGAGKTRLTGAYLEKCLGTLGTARNWRTVTRLLAMARH